MEKKLKLDLIREAQKHLTNNQRDWAHDVTHHYRTVQLARKIARNSLAEVDNDLLEVVCWWHDVILPNSPDHHSEAAEYTAHYLAKHFEGAPKKKVVDAITNHEFGNKPNSTEGQILQDADKLEVLSSERLRIAVESIEAGYYDREKAIRDMELIKDKWLDKMPGRYHFDYSRKLHQRRLKKVLPQWHAVLQKITQENV